MTETKRPVNLHKAYHAHVYFNEDTKVQAKTLCDEVGERFGLKIGRFHEKRVGPHPRWSCQVLFDTKDFDRLIPWLDEKRQGLTIFVHPITGDDYEDHTDYAYWLGQEVALDLSLFEKTE